VVTYVEHRLRVLENRVKRRYSDLLREEKIALRAFTICIPHVWGDQAG
jgi:hypothetical protein